MVRPIAHGGSTITTHSCEGSQLHICVVGQILVEQGCHAVCHANALPRGLPRAD
jgi:hypothetical protein